MNIRRSLALVSPNHICDLLKGIILAVTCYLLTFIDSSVMYHTIRGQSTIKLYVIFNVLEVNDGAIHSALISRSVIAFAAPLARISWIPFFRVRSTRMTAMERDESFCQRQTCGL